MPRTRVLCVHDAPARFDALFEAARALGSRIGWLRLDQPSEVPEALHSPLAHGAARAASVGAGASVAAKRLAGPAILRDVLREHFPGCALVLVRAPRVPAGGVVLEAAGNRLALVSLARRQECSASELLAAVARPSFWAGWQNAAAE